MPYCCTLEHSLWHKHIMGAKVSLIKTKHRQNEVNVRETHLAYCVTAHVKTSKYNQT